MATESTDGELEQWEPPSVIVVTMEQIPGMIIEETVGVVRGFDSRRLDEIPGSTPPYVPGQFMDAVIHKLPPVAIDMMQIHARDMGANAIVGMRMDASVGEGMVGLLVYGTAVKARYEK